MKKWITLVLTFILMMGLTVPSLAAAPAKIDKTHLAFLDTYAAAYSAGDVKKFKALLESPKLFIESSAEDFKTIADFNANTGLFKFYVGDEVKLVKQNAKSGAYTYSFDMYTLTTTDTDVIVQKMAVQLAFKKSGKTFKISSETVGDTEQLDDLSLIPAGVMKKMDADHKKLYDITLTEAIAQVSASK